MEKKIDIKKYFMLAIVVAIILLLFLAAKNVFFILLLLALNAIVGFALRPFKSLAIGFEVAVLTNVICTVAYGLKVGMIVGILSVLIKLAAQGSFTIYGLVIIPSHVLISVFASIFSGTEITSLGIGLTIFHNAFTAILNKVLFGAPIGKIFNFVVTNIIGNFILFTALAPVLLMWMA